jgi:hypothetical protein
MVNYYDETATMFVVLLCMSLLIASDADANVCVYKPAKVHQIIGVVVDLDGRPIRDAKVVVIKDQVQIAEQQSKENGTFVFDSVSAGQYEIQVNARGFMRADYPVTVYRPTAHYNRSMRIELAIGGEDCIPAIKLTKNRVANK